MFFNSIKEINWLLRKKRLRKKIDWLLRKRMSNIYLKVTIKKNLRSENFDFLNFTNLSASFWGAPAEADILEF